MSAALTCRHDNIMELHTCIASANICRQPVQGIHAPYSMEVIIGSDAWYAFSSMHLAMPDLQQALSPPQQS